MFRLSAARLCSTRIPNVLPTVRAASTYIPRSVSILPSTTFHHVNNIHHPSSIDQVFNSPILNQIFIEKSIDQQIIPEITQQPTDSTIYTDSVMRKRRLKMKKHKLRKRRRAQRSLKKRLGKL